MSNLITHAKREFILAGWLDKETDEYIDDMHELLCKQVLALLQLFADHSRSDSSTPYVIQLFNTLAKFNTITKLTGEDDEWVLSHEDEKGRTYQNIRDREVFKSTDLEDNIDRTYWIYGKIFKPRDGSMYTNNDSFVDITFPWGKPDKAEIIEVP